MSARIFETPAALLAAGGERFGPTEWVAIEQDRIDLFAQATDDHQWIHVDPERARRESPYGSTIAHGYLTLSLLPHLIDSCLRIDGVGMVINYGLDRVRLPAPVLAGQRVRARLVLDRLEPVAGGVQAHWSATVELEHGDKPACIAQMLVRYYPDTTSKPIQ